MLRALQKKVRNINKKLTEITELSTKKDLKPEQEEKVSKKPQVLQEKEKYLEMIEIYKEIAAENEKIIRKAQLAELEDLASILAAKEYLLDLGLQSNMNVDNIGRILTTPTSADLTLKQRIEEISASLIEAASNSKLKKNIKKAVEENQDKKKVEPQTSEPPAPVALLPIESKTEEIKEEVKEIIKEEKPEPLQIVVEKVEEPQVVSSPPVVQETSALKEDIIEIQNTKLVPGLN